MDLEAAIAAFEKFVKREPDFIIALKNLAFLMDREIARQDDLA